MQPTLNPDSSLWRDLVFFDRFSIGTLGNWNREDIVALRSPINPEQLLVKRIVALEGDTVKTLPPYPDAEVTVPEGHIWVEGDNYRTEDSNLFGPVPLALLDSKLTYIVWPLNRSGPLEQPTIPMLPKGGSRGPTWSHKMAEIERIQSRRARVKIAEAPPERISPAAEVHSWYQEKLAWIIGMDTRRP
ncbi:LexA/Signal peptidase [Athelia psychrophila]|nr:LexA/Signal peptidase [Fibularhizoctonia sp. CBS 109695]